MHKFVFQSNKDILRCSNWTSDTLRKNVVSNHFCLRIRQVRPMIFACFRAMFLQHSIGFLHLAVSRIFYGTVWYCVVQPNIRWFQLNAMCDVLNRFEVPIQYALDRFSHLMEGLQVPLILLKYPDITSPITFHCLILPRLFKNISTGVGRDAMTGAGP